MNVLIAGDFAPCARLDRQICKKDYGKIFSNRIRTIINAADFSFVNLESPIIEYKYEKIPKCGPSLHCAKEAAEAIKYAGFTGVTLANNHILDYGKVGLVSTVESCREQGLDTVGVGKNLDEAADILYLDKKSETLAIINCCEHEFSIATEENAGANPLNPIKQYNAICEARKKAKYVVVIVHGGPEHYKLPTPRMQDTYRFFIDVGADAVINHHQHCYSGYEEYRGKMIFYGLGNFGFDVEHNTVGDSWNLGYMVGLNFSEQVAFTIYPYVQYAQRPTIELLEVDALDKELNRLNAVISNSSALHADVKQYYIGCSDFERSILEPYSGRVLNKLFSFGLLPKFVKGRKAIAVLNHVSCESHREKLIFALNQERK